MSNPTLTPPQIDESGFGSPVQQNGSGTSTRRGLGSRLSVGHVLTAVAGVLTFLFLLVVLAERSNPEVTVVVAAELVEEGVPLTADLFEEVSLPEDNPLADGAVTTLDELDGSEVAQRLIPEGGVLTEADFIAAVAETPGGGLRSMSIPVESDQALGGQIRDSDVVDIVAVSPSGAWIPAAGLEVIGSGGDSSSLLGDVGTETEFISLAVTADEAVAISFASANAKEIFVVRSTGAQELEVLEPVDGESEVGVGGPAGGTTFAPADVTETLNDALGGVLDDIVANAGDDADG